MHLKASWAGMSAALTNIIYTTTISDCQTPSGQIPGDEAEQGTDGDWEK